MAANRTLKNKFKAHVGRTFSLRKVKNLSGFSVGKAAHAEKERWLCRSTDLGDAVFVLDETNTRVCVISATGQSVWIQKYYLHKEIVGETFALQDCLTEAIADILEISKDLRGNVIDLTLHSANVQSRTYKESLCERLEVIAARLRSISDAPAEGDNKEQIKK